MNTKGIKIIIDFAHTPNGLEQALKTLRSHSSSLSDLGVEDLTSGKLISLIGCEGFRDIGKREMMGKIAGKLADYVIVTAVDPRGQLEVINKQIIKDLKKNYFVIDDRQEAINFAINQLAKKGDIVGIFGKGHESSMNLDGKHEIPWSDKEAVAKVL